MKKLAAILGGSAVSGFGFYSWVTYLFAGTGFALPICATLVVGGVVVGVAISIFHK